MLRLLADKYAGAKARAAAERNAAEATLKLSERARELAVGVGGGAKMEGYGDKRRRERRVGFGPSRGPADKKLDERTQEALRNDAQQALRTNSIARGLIGRMADLIVQDGFSFQALTDDAEWNADVEAKFAAWANSTEVDQRGVRSLAQMCYAEVLAGCTDGDIGWVPLANGRVQLIEGARVRGMGDSTVPAASTVRNGVEIDAEDREVAYWVSSWTGNPQRVPREEMRLMRSPHLLRANQSRGEPAIQAVLDRLDDIDSSIENVQMALEVQSLLTLVVTSPDPVGTKNAMEASTDPTEEDDEEYQGQTKQTSLKKPGAIMHLPTGSTVNALEPSQSTQTLESMVALQIALAGMDVGLPLVLAMLDFTKVNFSSGRAALQLAYVSMFKWQAWLVREFLTPVYVWWIGNEIRAGRIPFHADFAKHEFTAPPAPVLDVKVEAEASAFVIDKGLSTLKRETARIGNGDWESNLKQLSLENERKAELGVTIVQAPGTKTGNEAAEPVKKEEGQ